MLTRITSPVELLNCVCDDTTELKQWNEPRRVHVILSAHFPPELSCLPACDCIRPRFSATLISFAFLPRQSGWMYVVWTFFVLFCFGQRITTQWEIIDPHSFCVAHFLLLFVSLLCSPCPDLEMLWASVNDGVYCGLIRSHLQRAKKRKTPKTLWNSWLKNKEKQTPKQEWDEKQLAHLVHELSCVSVDCRWPAELHWGAALRIQNSVSPVVSFSVSPFRICTSFSEGSIEGPTLPATPPPSTFPVTNGTLSNQPNNRCSYIWIFVIF